MRSPHFLRALCLLGSLALALAAGCADREGPSLVKDRRLQKLTLGQHHPDADEKTAVGALHRPIIRGSSAFRRLVHCESDAIVFKDEERSGADHMMTPRLCNALQTLAARVQREWPDARLRVTEAWDERGEHGRGSVHYEGRAADITTSDRDGRKLGRLAALAVHADFDWVLYEDPTHVHVSVRR